MDELGVNRISRRYIGFDLSAKYAELATERLRQGRLPLVGAA